MTGGGRDDESPLSFTEVGEILHLIDRLDCDTFDLTYGGLRISLQRAGHTDQGNQQNGTRPTRVPAVEAPSARQPAHTASGPENHETDAGTTPPHGGEASGPGVMVAAPMTGTFYRSPAPGDPPFVQPGDEVKLGQTVALIEVMKLFSELKADVDGTVARIDAEDRSLVEYGQPLMWIDPR